MDKNERIVAKIKKKIDELISDPQPSCKNVADRIAANLRDEGCKGRIGSSNNCPIGNYLKKHGIESPGVCSIIYSITKGEYVCIRTPPSLVKFIAKFDAGHYPFLVSPPAKSRKKKK